jgi:hypothetical protein
MTEAVVVEGVAREVADEPVQRGLAVVEPRQSVQVGLGAVAALSDEDFERNLALLRKGVERARLMQRALLEEGIDYGTEPGISRPFLHKSGAEKFEKAYGFAISYEIERKTGDGDRTPALEYIVHAEVHLGDTQGPVIAEGVGSCNTHESKYRFRLASRECPDCHKPSIIKGREDGRLRGKWWCASFKDGCGHTFEANDPRIADQQVGQVENENPHDLANTVLKMARKRAGVDAILTATGTSGLFTQDDDSPVVARDAEAARVTEPKRATQATSEASEGASKPPASTSSASNRIPAVPKDIEDPTPIGRVAWQDVAVSLGSGPPVDGRMRQTPDGPSLGFKVKVGNRNSQVVALGGVAEGIAAATGGDPKKLDGISVSVAGSLSAIPWDSDGEKKPPFLRLYPDVVAGLGWRVPPKGAPVAPIEPEPELDPAEDVAVQNLRDELDAQQIAWDYAQQTASAMYGGKSIEQLSSAQREGLRSALVDDLPW